MKTLNSIWKSINKWGMTGLASGIIVVYLIWSSGYSSDQISNNTMLTNILFALINLFVTFYVAQKAGVWGWKNDMSESQKKLARTAIRHNRSALNSVIKLMAIVESKKELIEEQLTKQYFEEIGNHLTMHLDKLQDSVNDFKEIVNEEIQEENLISQEIAELLKSKKNLSNQLKSLSEHSENQEEEINLLNDKLLKIEKDLREKTSQLKINEPFLFFGTKDLLNKKPVFLTTNKELSETNHMANIANSTNFLKVDKSITDPDTIDA